MNPILNPRNLALTALLAALAAGAVATAPAIAQDAPHHGRPGSGRGPAAQATDTAGAEARPAHRPPLIAALDANDDGIIDATELANAAAALSGLDANQDGQLTQDEVRPQRPAGAGGGGPRHGKGAGRGGHRPPPGEAPAAE